MFKETCRVPWSLKATAVKAACQRIKVTQKTTVCPERYTAPHFSSEKMYEQSKNT